MNFCLFTPSYSHPHLIAFPLSSLAGKERLKDLLGSAYVLQKDIYRDEINLLQKLDQFLSRCRGLLLVLTYLQIVSSPAPGHSYSDSWLQYFDFKAKVQVIIIFLNSFRNP